MLRTEQEIRARLIEVYSDARYHYPSATVMENAPLALIQTVLETQAAELAWVLGIKPEPKKAKAKR